MEMISILQHIHENYIPHTDDNPPSVIRKIVFGGDVLTNERAYSAQLAMLNGQSDYFRLSGVVYRPEGLHRMMNFILVLLMLSCQLMVPPKFFVGWHSHWKVQPLHLKFLMIFQLVALLDIYTSQLHDFQKYILF